MRHLVGQRHPVGRASLWRVLFGAPRHIVLLLFFFVLDNLHTNRNTRSETPLQASNPTLLYIGPCYLHLGDLGHCLGLLRHVMERIDLSLGCWGGFWSFFDVFEVDILEAGRVLAEQNTTIEPLPASPGFGTHRFVLCIFLGLLEICLPAGEGGPTGFRLRWCGRARVDRCVPRVCGVG